MFDRRDCLKYGAVNFTVGACATGLGGCGGAGPSTTSKQSQADTSFPYIPQYLYTGSGVSQVATLGDWFAQVESMNLTTESIENSIFRLIEIEWLSHMKLIKKTASIFPVSNQDNITDSVVPCILRSSRSNLKIPNEILEQAAILQEDGFLIARHSKNIYIVSENSTGVLYGFYELLRSFGFEWEDAETTSVPNTNSETQYRATASIVANPRIKLRGFWTFKDARASNSYLIWLARNQFNLAGKANSRIARALGIQLWGAEHELLQLVFSEPGLFEKKPEYFGMKNGQRIRINSTGEYFNPNFANPETSAYFASEVVNFLNTGYLNWVDILNIWTHDDRFNSFDQSPEALALGNETDNYLHFCFLVSKALSDAYDHGLLARKVSVMGHAYLLTMKSPTNARIIEQIANQSNYLHTFYPIYQSWGKDIGADGSSTLNDEFTAVVHEWTKTKNLKTGVVDYPNMSLFGGLYICCESLFKANEIYYEKNGFQAMRSSMHLMKSNAGPSRLTYRLQSKTGWQISIDRTTLSLNANLDAAATGYFLARYDKKSSYMRAVYERLGILLGSSSEIVGLNSLEWLLFNNKFWPPGYYSNQEVIDLIERFLAGGKQLLPGRYNSPPREYFNATFIGLNESLAGLAALKLSLSDTLNFEENVLVRKNITETLEWVDSGLARYTLVKYACDYFLSNSDESTKNLISAKASALIAQLLNSKILEATLSPVDQKATIRKYLNFFQNT